MELVIPERSETDTMRWSDQCRWD